MLATFETAWIESHANNLPCGDKDSLGVFQQRPSQGWGTREQILNITYSTNKFLDGAIPAYTAFPRYSAGKIAQSVQYSEFPTRYDAAAGTALALIARAQLDLGLPQLPPLTGVEDALLRLAPGTLDATCGDVQAVNAGDTCTTLRKAHGTTLAQLRFARTARSLCRPRTACPAAEPTRKAAPAIPPRSRRATRAPSWRRLRASGGAGSSSLSLAAVAPTCKSASRTGFNLCPISASVRLQLSRATNVAL